ncbi:MAG: Fic family protein [Desulfobulbus sp.]|nr:Fic family protein [Desulfobulbus sp.]
MQTYQWIWQHANWPHFSFHADQLLSDLSEASKKIGSLETISQTISAQESTAALERVLSDDALETSAIEGETLRRSSVRSSIRRKLGLPIEQEDKDIRTDGLIAMLFDARNQIKEPLTSERMQGWHAALFPTGYSGLKKIRVGQYRGLEEMQIVSGPVGKETVHYIASPHSRLDIEMERFLRWVNTTGEHPPLIKAGIAHLWFIMIHPFDDGNGRVGRAIIDYIMAAQYPRLMQLVSFSKQFSHDRKGYYAALEEAGKGGMDITAWLRWFLQATISAMQEAQWVVDTVVQKTSFWQMHQGTALNERQRKVINRLLDAGEQFIGNMTTRKYAGMTKCSKVTASRDLADLVEKGVLQKTASGGRSTSYILYMDVKPNTGNE